MKTTKKMISVLLSVLMSAAVFAGCANAPTDQSDTTTEAVTSANGNESAETESIYDKDGYLKDTLDSKLNYNGDTVNILHWSDRLHEEYIADDINGEIVNDAIYYRNEAVKNRLGVEFNFIGTRGDASNVSNFTGTVENGLKAGTQPYDIVSAHSFSIGSCAAKGFLTDISNAENIDFSKPWWPETLISKSTINDKLYFVSGDISANAIYMMYVTFFNKLLLDEYKLDNPYDFVADGSWTIDKQLSMCKDVYIDLNNNGVKDIGDQFGQYAYTNHLDTFLWGSDIVVIDVTGDAPVISEEFMSEKVQNLQEKLRTFFYNSQDGLVLTVNSSVHQHFMAGISLFWNDCCRNATVFAKTELSYGIVPIPKYDESQESYTTLVANPFSLYAIPNDSQKIDELCAVLECMASESYRKLSPVIFETAMKYKYSRDDKSSQMFDIVKENVVFDLGRIFSTSLGTPTGVWQKSITEGTPWMTTMRIQIKTWSKQITELMKAFE
ncbi:MAG: hypothetical protein MJ137_01220 [Clostridia bacterium]|nr:hypothetical protein [Clostridia bacterium]